MDDLPGVPRVPPGTIARAHLDAVLDAGAPLCVLRGPGGTGKTTLLARWVRSLPDDHAVVWLTVDPETASRAGFWVRVLTRLNAAGMLDHVALHGATTAIADAADQLPAVLARVFEAAPPLLLVLDDFAASGAFWDGVCTDVVALVRQIATLRIAVAGRRPTSLEGPSTGLTVETRVLDAAALAATDDDVRALLAAAGFMPDDAAVVDLATRMPARSIRELRYAIELLARQRATPPHRAGSPGRMVRPAEQSAASTMPAASAAPAAVPSPGTLSPSVPLTPSDIAASMPTAVRRDLGARLRDRDATDFLGALALAPYGDRALAQALAETLDRGRRPGQNGASRTSSPAGDPGGDPGGVRRRRIQDGDQVLATLEAEGLGHWVDAVGGARFEVSAPVRAVAAARFAAAHPRATAEVLTVVAHWLVSHRDDVGGAIEHALRAGDLDLADSLVLRARPLSSDVCGRIDTALGALPVAQVRAYPFLALVHGAYLFSRPEPRPRAREFLRAAAQGSPGGGRGRSRPERLAVYGLEAMVWRLLGNRGRMLDRARRALREVTVSRDESSPESHGDLDALAVLVLDQVALSLLMGDDVAAARRAYDVLDTIARERGWTNGWGIAAGGRALLAMLDGRMGDLRTELADARWSGNEPAVVAAPGLAVDGERGWLHAITAAWAHLDDGDAEGALARLAPLDELAGTVEQWELHAGIGALAELMAGRPADARARLAHARRTRAGPATLPSARARLIAVQATVELAAGTGRGMPRRGVHGPAAAVDLALRAYTASVHGATDDAVALLAQAQAATVTPLHQALTSIAGIVVATRTDAALQVDQFASELAAVVAAAGLHWPLMLLGERERAALTAALASDAARGAMRAALSTVPPAVGEGLWTKAQVPRLTPGEVTVLHQLARTAARAQIAAALHVSINTVKAQLGSLYAKLGVRSREDALTRAVALGLLVMPDGWDADQPERPDQPERAEVGDVPR